MKKLIFSVFVLFTFLCAKCEDETPKNLIDLLPPATQTGANTFGCLVDGEAFTPDNRPNSLIIEYSYYDGGYYLRVSGSRRYSEKLLSIGVATENMEIIEGEKYNLLSPSEDGSAYGEMYSKSNFNYTSSTYSGELNVSKHDFTNRIISGTFWYDIKDVFGDVHEVREGRFDIKY